MTDGLKAKYIITKADGTPCEGRYFVLKLDSKDPVHARASQLAARTYAQVVLGYPHLEQLGLDLLAAVRSYLSSGGWAVWDELIGGGE
jgi:hypothetical protein